MLKEKARAVAFGVLVLDLIVVTVSVFVSYWIRGSLLPELGLVEGGLFPREAYLPLLPLAVISSGAFLIGSGRYRSHRRIPILQEVGGILRSCFAGAALLVSLIYLFRLDTVLLGDEQISRSWVIIFSVLTCTLLLVERSTIRLLARFARSRGYNYRTIVIVGTNLRAWHISKIFRKHFVNIA